MSGKRDYIDENKKLLTTYFLGKLWNYDGTILIYSDITDTLTIKLLLLDRALLNIMHENTF